VGACDVTGLREKLHFYLLVIRSYRNRGMPTRRGEAPKSVKDFLEKFSILKFFYVLAEKNFNGV
jgi:hypothetical protein